MEFKSVTSTLLLITSLLSPSVWALKNDADWRESILNECSSVYAQRLAEGPVDTLSASTRYNLARAVCSESRVFYGFAEARFPEELRYVESQGPMVIGIQGLNVGEVSAATHALNRLFYAMSNEILPWSRDGRRVQRWANSPQGGAWDGVVYVQFEERGRGHQMEKSERAREAYDFMSSSGMSASVLAITAIGDERPKLNGLDIKWANLEAPVPCPAYL